MASVMQDEATLLEIFFHELFPHCTAISQQWTHMRKNNKTEPMNEISTNLTDVSTNSAFQANGRCALVHYLGESQLH